MALRLRGAGCDGRKMPLVGAGVAFVVAQGGVLGCVRHVHLVQHALTGRLRSGAHPAIDFAGRVGDPVLAAADGTVTYATYSQLCGNGIWIQHVGFDRFTLYCHLSKMQVSVGDRVKRGQLIGAFGATGEPTMRAIFPAEPLPQLHFSLQDRMSPRNDGQLDGTFDPMSAIVGCFDPAKSYPTDQLVLTYPLRCK